MGKVFIHFSKPARRFVEDCIYGMQASGDANHCRFYGDAQSPKKNGIE